MKLLTRCPIMQKRGDNSIIPQRVSYGGAAGSEELFSIKFPTMNQQGLRSSAPVPASGAAITGADEKPVEEASPAGVIPNTQTCKRNVAIIGDVAKHLVRQAEREGPAAVGQHRKFPAAEQKRFERLMEEERRIRQNCLSLLLSCLP
uniref:Uncharacterized protein n=1 Tax=Sphaerodactylus townsendi TaxID=933632 RepID=A0ACB8F010_9SAUR